MPNVMKDSGIIWLGKIPSNWNVVNYRRLFIRRKEYDNNPNKQVLSLTIEGVKEKNESFGKMAEDFTGHQKVHKGDLIFTPRDFDATPILSGVAPCDGCISNLYFVLYPRDKDIHIPFYNYFMWGCKWGGDIWKKLSYGMRFSYNYQQFCSLPALSLPYEQQQKIADYLDEKCGKIDSVIENQKKIIEKLKEYKQSLITEAVTKGLNPNVKMKDSGIEWIGQIPKHWDMRRLRYLFSCQNGISKSAEYFGKGSPFVSYGDVYKNEVLPVAVNQLCEVSDDEKERYSVKKGDIFYTRTSETIEEIGLTSICYKDIENATFAGFLIRIRPKTELLNIGYSKYYVSSNIHRRFFVKEMNLVTRASLSQELLKKLPILIPPYSEQQEIAEFLDNKCGQIDKAIQQKEETITKIEEYKKSLIYECITGKKELV